MLLDISSKIGHFSFPMLHVPCYICYILDVRVNSVAHRVPWWRIRLWPVKCVFYDMILHQAGMHVRGMFGYVWHDWRN